jgi:hypothetical protein
MAENTKNQKTTGEKVRSTVKEMAGKVLKDEAQKNKKGILALIGSFIFGGLFGTRSGSSDNQEEGGFKDSHFVLSNRDERLYSEAKNDLTFNELVKIGRFENEMEESDLDFVFFRKNIANIQSKYNKSQSKSGISPAAKRLKMIIQAKNFEEQKLVVGSSLGQKEFFKKKNFQRADKVIGGALIVVAVSIFLVLIALFSVVLFTMNNF